MGDKNSEYSAYRLANIINIQKIVTINLFEVGRNFQHMGEKHDFWELVYVDKGELIVETDDETFTLERGECVFHRPGEYHAHKANGVVAPNYFVMCFTCDSKPMNFLAKKKIKFTEKQKKIISNIIEEANTVFVIPWNYVNKKSLELHSNQPIGGQQLIKTYLDQLLIFLLRQEVGNIGLLEGNPTEAKNIAERIKQKLDTYAYKDFNLLDFCREMGYSKSYLSRVFVREYGYTIHNYVTELKMREAKKLIREHIYNFTEISEMLCYSNPFYFSTVFTKVMAMTPSEYKKSVASNL